MQRADDGSEGVTRDLEFFLGQNLGGFVEGTRRNLQLFFLRSHFTWCDDGQEILAHLGGGGEEELVWAGSHIHRLDCLGF